MTNQAKQLLLTALITVRDQGPSSLKDGICRNAVNVIEKMAPHWGVRADAISTMTSMMERWPNNAVDRHHWAADVYPVEGGVADYLRAIHDGVLWQNPRRIELLNWLIQELENELAGSTENNPG